jgi:hypothetical protein
VAQAGVNIAVNDVVLSLLAGAFVFLPPWADNNLAKVIAMLCASVVSFVLLRTVVFSERTAVQLVLLPDEPELAEQLAGELSQSRPPVAPPEQQAS